MRRFDSGFRGKIVMLVLALVLAKTTALALYMGGYFPDGVSSAHAQAESPSPEKAPTEPSATPTLKNPAAGELDIEIIRDVERRSRELDQKEEDLKRREERVNAMQADMDKQISQLLAIQAKIEEQIKLRSDLEDQAIAKLAKTYSSMPPENAAALVAQLDQAIAIRVLAAMKEKSAGRILAVTPPDLATKLSEGLVRKKETQ